MKIIFAGTPDFAATCLSELLSHNNVAADKPQVQNPFEIVAVYTQPDRPAGRGRKIKLSPVKSIALEADIPVEQPTSLRTEENLEVLQSYSADIMIVVAYGIILPETVLNSFPLGCINVHASLLPKWRGAAPIQRAIAAGDKETGITIMQMEKGLDTGPMISAESVSITNEDNGETLHNKLAHLGAKLLVSTLAEMKTEPPNATPQDNNQATYAHKLTKEEALIDWNLSATHIYNQVRAYNPWPVAYTLTGEQTDQRVRVWTCSVKQVSTNQPPGTILNISRHGVDIATGEGVITLLELQLPGGKRLNVEALINAQHSWLSIGAKLSG